VKYYPDDGQIKAKDMNDAKLCTMQSERLRSAPGVCFLSDMTEEEQLLVFAIFMILD